MTCFMSIGSYLHHIHDAMVPVHLIDEHVPEEEDACTALSSIVLGAKC